MNSTRNASNIYQSTGSIFLAHVLSAFWFSSPCFCHRPGRESRQNQKSLSGLAGFVVAPIFNRYKLDFATRKKEHLSLCFPCERRARIFFLLLGRSNAKFGPESLCSGLCVWMRIYGGYIRNYGPIFGFLNILRHFIAEFHPPVARVDSWRYHSLALVKIFGPGNSNGLNYETD